MGDLKYMYIILIIICTTLSLFALALLIEAVANARLNRKIKKHELENIENEKQNSRYFD